MSENNDAVGDSATFVRQRRNFMLTSIATLFVLWLGLSLDEVNLLGNRFSVAHPRAVAPIGWVLLGYFLLRYWQVFSWAAVRKDYEQCIRELGEPIVWGRVEDAEHGFLLAERKSTMVLQGDSLYFVCTYMKVSTSGNAPATGASRDVPLAPDVVARIKRKAPLRAVFNRPVVTEHFFPFVVAALPLVYAAWRALCH